VFKTVTAVNTVTNTRFTTAFGVFIVKHMHINNTVAIETQKSVFGNVFKTVTIIMYTVNHKKVAEYL